MKIKSLFTTFLLTIVLSSSIFAADSTAVNETKKYRTGDQLSYPLRSKLYDYTPSLGKNNVIYYITKAADESYDVKIDDFIFRLRKGDTFQTHQETKGTGEGFQSYIIRTIISEEVTDITNNHLEITYKIVRTEKYLKKGMKGDYEKVDKFPWD